MRPVREKPISSAFLQHARGLAHLDEVPIRVAHVAPDLGSAVDRRGQGT